MNTALKRLRGIEHDRRLWRMKGIYGASEKSEGFLGKRKHNEVVSFFVRKTINGVCADEAQRSKFLHRSKVQRNFGNRKREWGSSYGFKVSAAASVGASVLRTEVSTGHPHPVSRTRPEKSEPNGSDFLCFFDNVLLLCYNFITKKH